MSERPHDSWARVYDAAYGQSFGALYQHLTEATLKTVAKFAEPGTSILDVGAGTGRLSVPLSKRGYSVCAVDASDEMLSVLQEKDQEHAIRAVHGSIQHLNLKEYFDNTLCVFSVFCYLLEKRDLFAAIESIARHTIADGWALIDIPQRSAFSGMRHESETLRRRVDVSPLDEDGTLFEYYERLSVSENNQINEYTDRFQIRHWDSKLILDEFESAGMIIHQNLSDRFLGSAADYFLLQKTS